MTGARINSRPGESLAGLIAATHPFPAAMVVLVTTLFAIEAGGKDVSIERLALLGGAMAASQAAIGWTNDYVDRRKDSAVQPEKPIARGLVQAKVLPPAIGIALVAALAMAAVLGPVPLALMVGGTACGLAYDFGLKDTRWSWIAYVAGFALLPLYAWAGIDAFRGRFLWLYAFGPPLVVAIHLANAIPDIEKDRMSGARGLAVLMGRKDSIRAVNVLLLIAVVVALGVAFALGVNNLALALTIPGACVLAVLVERRYAHPERDRSSFRLIAAASLVLAAGWLAAV